MGKIKTALISLWDKENIELLANVLMENKIRVISTGKTAKRLREFGLNVQDVSGYTGSAEILSGRVKTLHPKVHAGLLFRRDNPSDIETLNAIGALPIDLVVVNLYPFGAAFEQGKRGNDLLEFIDIGGPTMLRAAAKNYPWVTVVSNVSDYSVLEKELRRNNGRTSLAFRKKMAAKAFALTGRYDAMISNALVKGKETLSDDILFYLLEQQPLRYGENPHQNARFYMPFGEKNAFKLLGGKELSYNNIMDMSSAYEMAVWFKRPAAVVVKHSNPCGLALDKSLDKAYIKAYKADALSAFGGIIAFNGKVDGIVAKAVIESGFRELVIAPDFDKAAIEILKRKKNLRIVKARPKFAKVLLRRAFNGYLAQDADTQKRSPDKFKAVTKKKPTKRQLADLSFAWDVARFVKSNAIVLAKSGVTSGIGAGQMSRVDAVELAIKKAGPRAEGSVLASDGFFPKVDNIEFAGRAGIKAIVQPGGSKADADVIAKCDELGIAMVFTGMRHFRH